MKSIHENKKFQPSSKVVFLPHDEKQLSFGERYEKYLGKILIKDQKIK
jgi:hypothetical protein